MGRTILDIIFLCLLAWIAAAHAAAGWRYAFTPYYVSAAGCVLAACAVVGELLMPTSDMAGFFGLAQLVGVVIVCLGFLLNRSEERRRGINRSRVMLFRSPLAPPTTAPDAANRSIDDA